MSQFASAREAKEFLAGRIVDEAQREGISLSEVERKMLYFSETHWAPPDILETNAQFEREYDQTQFETKIAQLIRNARKRTQKEEPHEFEGWSDAIGTLKKEDHYLLVMVEQAGSHSRPRGSYTGFHVTVIACFVGGLLGLRYVAGQVGIPPSILFWYICAVLVVLFICASVAWLIYRRATGRKVTGRAVKALLEILFG